MLWVEHMHPKFQRLFLDLQEIQVKPSLFPWYLLSTFLELCLFSVLTSCCMNLIPEILIPGCTIPRSSTHYPALLFSYLFSIQRGCRGRGWAFTFGLKPKVNFFVQKAEPKMNYFDAENVSSLRGNSGQWSGEDILLLLHPGSNPPRLPWLCSLPSRCGAPPQVGGRGLTGGFLWCPEVPRVACSSTVICEMGRSGSEPLWPWLAFTGSSWSSIKVIGFF